LLGRYENFPENVHGVTRFETQNPTKENQKAILAAFYRLNAETFGLGDVTPYLKQDYEVGFEFGVAEGIEFNFLESNELNRCLENVNETETEVLDFFFAVRYHCVRNGGRHVPLKFDYCVMRCLFYEGGLEIRIRHEKGPQRVPLDELTGFLVKQVNVELSHRMLVSLFVGVFKKIRIQ
jgi:hypothetical protein